MQLANYTFLDVMWSMFIFFLWIIWFWLLFTVFVDVFRRHDIHGGKKTLWLIFVIILPFLGVFIYIITQNDGMTQRNLDRAQAQRSQFDQYVRDTASSGGGGGGAAADIADAKQLLDQGAITQDEFEALKRKALAT
jgi:hypothetical protein